MYRMTPGFGLSYGQPAPSAPHPVLSTLPSQRPFKPGPPTDGTVQLPPSEPLHPDPAGVVPGGGVTYPPDDIATPPIPPPDPPPPPSAEPEGGVLEEVTGWWEQRSGVEKGAVVLGFVGVGVAAYALGRRRGKNV